MRTINIIRTILFSTSALVTNVAFAQSADDRVSILERIVIGAGTEKVAIDTPQSVTVIEQEDIDRTQASTIADLIREIPGVNITGSERPLGQAFNIRGIGAPENSGDQGRIIVSVDGVNKFYEQYRTGSFFSEPELYKKVEVLRGPASSTLYGSGAIGGAINFETKDPSDFLQPEDNGFLKLKTSYSTNEEEWLNSIVFAHRISENVEFLASGNFRTANDYTTGNGTVVPGTDYNTWSGLAKLVAQTEEGGELTFSYQQWVSDEEDQPYDQTQSPLFADFGTVDRNVRDQTAVISYENPFEDNDWLDLKIALSYSNSANEQRNASGIAPGVFGPFAFGCAPAPAGSVLFCDSDYGYENLQFNFENTIDSQGENWDNFLTFGYQYSDLERTSRDLTGTYPAVTFHPEGSDTNHAFFVQNEFIWNEKLTIIPGIRFETRTVKGPGNLPGASNSDDTAISPKLAAHYKLNDNLAIFGSVAHTERFPTIDEVFTTSTNGARFLPSLGLQKEEADNWEVGMALTGEDMFQSGDSFQIKATYFDSDITNLIARNPATPATRPETNYTLPGFINIDEAEISGVEIEAAYTAESGYLNAAYTWTEGTDLTTGADLKDIAPSEFSFTVGAYVPEHDLELGWKSRIVSDPSDACRTSSAIVVGCPGDGPTTQSLRFSESFDVHDFFVTWKPEENQFKGWEARFGVDNIFDRQYKEFLGNDFAKGRTFKFTLARSIGWQ